MKSKTKMKSCKSKHKQTSRAKRLAKDKSNKSSTSQISKRARRWNKRMRSKTTKIKKETMSKLSTLRTMWDSTGRSSMMRILKTTIISLIKKSSRSFKRNSARAKPKSQPKPKSPSLTPTNKTTLMNTSKTTLIISGKFNSKTKRSKFKPNPKPILTTKLTVSRPKSSPKKPGPWKVKSKPKSDPATHSFNTTSSSVLESSIPTKLPRKGTLSCKSSSKNEFSLTCLTTDPDLSIPVISESTLGLSSKSVGKKAKWAWERFTSRSSRISLESAITRMTSLRLKSWTRSRN